jgi:hypothetical protein
LESRQIADLIRGGLLLAVAVLLAVLLRKFYQIFPHVGISVKHVYYFPIAIIGGICWVAYRGIRTIVTALKDTG